MKGKLNVNVIRKRTQTILYIVFPHKNNSRPDTHSKLVSIVHYILLKLWDDVKKRVIKFIRLFNKLVLESELLLSLFRCYT